MQVSFFKYQGTGNDFVMIDNRDGVYNDLSIKQIQSLCDRKFGVGADGLIKLNLKAGFDFEMDYYNSDGSKSFCGNGARCSVAFALTLGIQGENIDFSAIDGLHNASKSDLGISLAMLDVTEIEQIQADYFLNTGSPHYISFHDSISDFPVLANGRAIRNSERFIKEGVNVNFVEVLGENNLFVRTYERGVEDETLSCGTGVTAAAIAYAKHQKIEGSICINIRTLGGELKVSFNANKDSFTEIFLDGPAEFVFKGSIHV
jgi:diaminopimelate epimerase